MISIDRIRPFKHRVSEVLRLLPGEGFQLISGADDGWFGGGRYVVGNGQESIRISRARKEEEVEVAYCRNPSEMDWIGIADLMLAVGDLTLEQLLSRRGIPHDLDFQMQAYLRIRPKIAAQLGPNPATHERLARVREEFQDYVQRRYGRRA